MPTYAKSMRRTLLAFSLLLTACGTSGSAGEDHDAGSAAHDGAAPEGSAATDAGPDATQGEGGVPGGDGGVGDGSMSGDAGDASLSSDAAGTGDATPADASGADANGADGSTGGDAGVTSAGCTQGAGIQAGAPWPMVERCPTREGFGAASSLAAPAAVTWTQNLNGLLATAPTIAADGTLYVGGLDLYALTADGTQKWVALVGHPVGAATIAADGTIVVVTADETLRAYNPDGTSKWTYAFGGTDDSTGSPAIAADGTIYFATSLVLYSVSSAGALNWSQSNGYRSNPVLAGDGTLYIEDGLDNLLAIHPTGVGAWTYKAAGLGNGDPIVGADGRIYFAANPGLNADQGYVYAMNPDGTNAWTASTPTFVDRIGMGPDGTIYFQGLDDTIRQVTSSGSLGWTHTLKYPASCGTFAVAGDGTLYVTCGNNADAPASVEAIRPDGTTAWTLSLLTTQLAYSYPAIGADGSLYFGWQTLMAIRP